MAWYLSKCYELVLKMKSPVTDLDPIPESNTGHVEFFKRPAEIFQSYGRFVEDIREFKRLITWRLSARAEIPAQLIELRIQPGLFIK